MLLTLFDSIWRYQLFADSLRFAELYRDRVGRQDKRTDFS